MTVRLSTTEYAVLGLLAEGASHGFALSKFLAADGEIGRVFRVRRPLVYRALDRLVEAGYAEPMATEKGDAGPQRNVHSITSRGRRRLDEWLAQPVGRVRDIRIEFLLKLALLHRRGLSPLDLIRDQRNALLPRLNSPEAPESEDYVDLWRQHNTAAALTYLDDLESRETTS